jgi:hypothetical protein
LKTAERQKTEIGGEKKAALVRQQKLDLDERSSAAGKPTSKPVLIRQKMNAAVSTSDTSISLSPQNNSRMKLKRDNSVDSPGADPIKLFTDFRNKLERFVHGKLF